MQAEIISFVAKGTNSGKTYLMEKLIAAFKSRGKRVTAVKHGTHRMEIDKKGKDTYKFAQQGADRIILFSDSALLMYELKAPDLDHLVSLAREGADLVLLEGFKNSPFKKIEVFNPELYGSPMCLEETAEGYIAIVSRVFIDVKLPWFSFDDIEALCDFIEEQSHGEPLRTGNA